MALSRLEGRSFKKSLTITFLLISLLPLAAASLLTLFLIDSKIENENRLKTENLNRTINYQINQFFETPSAVLQQLAAFLDHTVEIESHDVVDPLLEASLASSPILDRILILDSEASVLHLVPYREDFLGMDFSRQPLFESGENENKIHWSDVFISSINGKPTISGTIRFDKGYVVANINLEHLIQRISVLEIGKNGFAIVTDEHGTVIVHPQVSLVSQKSNMSGTSEYRSSRKDQTGQILVERKGEIYLVSFSKVRDFDWQLFLYQDYHELRSLVTTLMKIILTVFFATLAIIILPATVMAKRIIKPIDLLNDVTTSLGSGSYDLFPWKRTYRELNSLAESYRHMIKEVNSRNQENINLRRRFISIIDSMPSVVFAVDAHMNITLWNEKARESTGLSSDEVITRNIREILPLLTGYEEQIISCLLQKKTIALNRIRLESNTFGNYLDIIMFPLVSGDKTEAVIRLDNITELMQSVQMMQQSEKLNALGKLSAGISHDLNNMLTPIMGFSELLKEKGQWDGEAEHYVDGIISASKKSQNLVRQLLVFSRKQKMEVSTLNLNNLASDFLNLIRHTIPENITITHEWGKDVPPIRGDGSQINQIMMNLAINSKDAMPEGGVLEIATEKVYLEEALDSRWNWKGPGQFSCLIIRDTGLGIDQAILSKIFDPFFSTKGNKGTGLGLSIVFSIADQHEAFVSLSSVVGKGTEFRIYFPACGETEREQAVRPQSELPQGQKETVLLVEDEKQVSRMVRIFLTNLNYHPVCASDAEEALRIFNMNPAAIKVLITDIIMPGMNGRDLAETIRTRRADLPVLFMSGYTNRLLTPEDLDRKQTGFIEKPFSMAQLSLKLEGLLHDNQP